MASPGDVQSLEHPSGSPPGHPWEREEPHKGGKMMLMMLMHHLPQRLPLPQGNNPPLFFHKYGHQRMGCPHSTSQKGDSWAQPAQGDKG